MIDLAVVEQYNTDAVNNIRKRIELLEKCNASVSTREVVLEYCKRDIIFWINHFVVAYNPRVKPSILPFFLFPKQIECINWILDCYKDDKFGTIVKARYCGASWIASCVLTHKLLFDKDFTGCFASNKATSVDQIGNPDALFTKVEMIVQRLPGWMHDIDLENDRKRNLIQCKSTNSVIIGQSGRNIGRGGRSSMVFVDEYAFVQFDTDALSALSENTDCCVFISTPRGKANKFFELSENPNIPTFYYHWTSDLRRSVEWREEQTRRFGKHLAAQELDCCFDTSTEGQLIDYDWIASSTNADTKLEFHDDDDTVYIGADIAVSGSNNTIVTIVQNRIVREIIKLPPDKLTQTAYRLIEIGRKYVKTGRIVNLTFDGDGVGQGVAAVLDDTPQLPFEVFEFHGGGRARDTLVEGISRSMPDVVANARAEGYWLLRERFRKTDENVNKQGEHDITDCISIPSKPELANDLNNITSKYNNSGKLLMESKVVMRQKGIKSPDYADSLMLACYNISSVDYLGAF